MANKGGYKIIDLQGVPLEIDQRTHVPNSYSQTQNPYNKMIMLSGLVIVVGGQNRAYPDRVSFPDGYTLAFYSDDTVLVTVS